MGEKRAVSAVRGFFFGGAVAKFALASFLSLAFRERPPLALLGVFCFWPPPVLGCSLSARKDRYTDVTLRGGPRAPRASLRCLFSPDLRGFIVLGRGESLGAHFCSASRFVAETPLRVWRRRNCSVGKWETRHSSPA